MCAVSGFTSLLMARLLLGMFEAGFFPGVLLYLTFWYSKTERGARMAIFYMAQCVLFECSICLRVFIMHAA